MRVSKARIFAEANPAEIRKLKKVDHPAEGELGRPKTGRWVETLPPDHYFLARTHLLPESRVDSKWFMQTGRMLRLRNDGRNIHSKGAKDLLIERLPLDRTTYMGAGWLRPGTRNTWNVMHLNELLEGFLIYWYDMNKYPGETEALQKKRLADEAKIYGADHEDVARLGVRSRVRIPARGTGDMDKYEGMVESIPWVHDKYNIASVWRNIRFGTERSEHAQHRNTRPPSRKLERSIGIRVPLFAQDYAQMFKIADRAWRLDRNIIPSHFLPCPAPSEAFVIAHLKATYNVIRKDGRQKGSGITLDGHREVLDWAFVFNHGADAFKPSGKLRDYRIGEFFDARTKALEKVYSSSGL